MPLKDKRTGNTLANEIVQMVESNFIDIRSSKEFSFNWEIEKENEIYKIYLTGRKQKF